MSGRQVGNGWSRNGPTVYSHLARAIALEWEPLDRVYTGPGRELIEEKIGELGSTTSVRKIYEACNREVTYGEIMCVVAGLEKNQEQV